MVKQTIKLSESGWIYCFKRGSKFVFLDRKDKLIKSFDTYIQAVTFANNNIHLISQNPIKNCKQVMKKTPCSVCFSSEYNLSELKMYKGLCIPCECKKMDREFDLQVSEELRIYQKKTREKYSFNEFLYACQDKIILKNKLKELPILNEIFERTNEN